MRRAAIAAGAGVALGAALLLFRRGDAWPAWLAAWVAWMALPLGAVPLVAGAGLARLTDGPFVAALRRLLWMLPAGAVLGVPLLLALPERRALGVAALLVAWSVLAVLLARPHRGGVLLGGVALALHVPLLSLAAGAASRALDPGFVSSSFGLLVISAQAGAAAAALLAAAASGGAASGGAASDGTRATRLVAALVAAWLFLHFTQYLVIWSADLPAEVVWYQQRTAGLGGALIGLAAVAGVAAIAVLSAGSLLRPPALLATGAVLLALHVLEMLWLVTPAYRGRFVVDFADATALAAGVCLAAALLRLAARPGGRGDTGGAHVAV